jgi:hypothetical protein
MRVDGVKCTIVILITLVVGMASQVGGLIQVSVASAENLSQINISAPADVPEGGAFTARINITPGATFNAYQIQVVYDPDVVQVLSTEGGTEGVTKGSVGSSEIPVDMWSFYPAGKRGGTIRILGKIPSNRSVNGSGYLAEIHFSVIGSNGDSSSITPVETSDFANGLFDSVGNKLATSEPWGGSAVSIYTPLNIDTSALSPACTENSYFCNLIASGGNTPYNWTGAGFPNGLAVTGNGTISGKPLQSGDYNIHLSLIDSSNPPAVKQKDLTLRVYPLLQITTVSLQEGVQGKSYSASIGTTDAAAPLIWSATGLPQGLNISGSGVLNGSPLVSGDYNINITVTDSFGPPHSVTRTLTLHLYAALTITTQFLPDGLEGRTYNGNIIAAGGKTPFSWSSTGLPSGLSLTSSGLLSGTPATSGDFNITAFVSDSFDPANNTSRAFTLHINPRLQMVTTALPEAVAGKSFSAILNAFGGIPPYNWSVSGLPEGLTCSFSGNISGIPTEPGNTLTNIILSDSFNPVNIISTSFDLHVYDALNILVSRLTEGVKGRNYISSLSASGSLAPYIWTVSALPAGLEATAAGEIRGMPAQAGEFILNISVTDSLPVPHTTAGTVILKIYKVGDADGNGAVNMGDATFVERVILGLAKETPGCDANLNGSVSIGDVTMIERIILGLN